MSFVLLFYLEKDPVEVSSQNNYLNHFKHRIKRKMIYQLPP